MKPLALLASLLALTGCWNAPYYRPSQDPTHVARCAGEHPTLEKSPLSTWEEDFCQ